MGEHINLGGQNADGSDATNYLTVTAHVQVGSPVGATPDGRLLTTLLNDSISPTQGRDIQSPTTGMNSVAKIDQSVSTRGMIYNMKVSPDTLAGEKNLKRFVDLIIRMQYTRDG